MNIIIQGFKSSKLITQGYAAAPEIRIYGSTGAVTRDLARSSGVTTNTIDGSTGATTRTIASSSGELDQR